MESEPFVFERVVRMSLEASSNAIAPHEKIDCSNGSLPW